jgi:hypothetical protein
MSRDHMIQLPPLSDGTSVEGIVENGRPIGVDAEWRDTNLGVAFVAGQSPIIEIGASEISLRNWPRRRSRYAQRSPELATAVDQVIERARAWQPHLFTK